MSSMESNAYPPNSRSSLYDNDNPDNKKIEVLHLEDNVVQESQQTPLQKEIRVVAALSQEEFDQLDKRLTRKVRRWYRGRPPGPKEI